MNPATKSKPAADRLPPLERVAQAEAQLAEAEAATIEAGTEAQERADRHAALVEQRANLVHQDPTLVNHKHEPVNASNAVAKVDAELGKLDVQDTQLRYGHAQELERVARQRAYSLLREYGALVEQDRRDEGEQLRADYEAKARALLDVAERMLGYGRRSLHLASIRGIDTYRVPLDPIANASRTIRELAATVPPVPWIEGGDTDD